MHVYMCTCMSEIINNLNGATTSLTVSSMCVCECINTSFYLCEKYVYACMYICMHVYIFNREFSILYVYIHVYVYVYVHTYTTYVRISNRECSILYVYTHVYVYTHTLLQDASSNGFLWEKFTTKPHVDSGEIRRVSLYIYNILYIY